MKLPEHQKYDWAQLASSLLLPLRRNIDGRGVGARRSSSIGDGLDIAGVRKFQDGDEVRRIDWSATARTGELHVRTMIAETGVRTLVALDHSESMEFGTAGWKAEIAADLTNLVGFAAAKRGDQVAIATASTGTSPTASGSRAQLLLSSVLAASIPASTEDLVVQLMAGTRPSVPSGLVVIISDLFSSLFTAHSTVLDRVGSRHELIVIVILDPAELVLPKVNSSFTFRANRSSNSVTVNLGDRSLHQAYCLEINKRRHLIETAVLNAGGQLFEVSTAGDPVAATINAFAALNGSGAQR